MHRRALSDDPRRCARGFQELLYEAFHLGRPSHGLPIYDWSTTRGKKTPHWSIILKSANHAVGVHASDTVCWRLYTCPLTNGEASFIAGTSGCGSIMVRGGGVYRAWGGAVAPMHCLAMHQAQDSNGLYMQPSHRSKICPDLTVHLPIHDIVHTYIMLQIVCIFVSHGDNK